MPTSRRDPFRDLVALQDRMSRLFEEALRPERKEDVEGGNWAPAADIFETVEELVLSLDLPGIPREAIDIRFDNNVLSIRGERSWPEELAAGQRHRVERPHGNFIRNFTLPAGVDAERITASCKEGVLTVRIPRASANKSRQIRIG